MFLSIDENFGLSRKKASGTSNHPTLHGQTMFLEQDEVNNYVANYAVTKARYFFLPCFVERYFVLKESVRNAVNFLLVML